MSKSEPLGKLAVALDTSDWQQFRRWCDFFGPRVGTLKVGLEAYVRWGPAAVEEARKTNRSIFLDLKLHDIPKTVAGAVQAAHSLEVRFLTIHSSGGLDSMRAAVAAAEGSVQLLGVTVLTHLDETQLDRLHLPGGVGSRVSRWAALAAEAGVDGVVCSPLELPELREAHPRPFVLVTPGIRTTTVERDDQSRTASASDALRAGADLLVVGRPLTGAADPERALESLRRQMSERDSGHER